MLKPRLPRRVTGVTGAIIIQEDIPRLQIGRSNLRGREPDLECSDGVSAGSNQGEKMDEKYCYCDGGNAHYADEIECNSLSDCRLRWVSPFQGITQGISSDVNSAVPSAVSWIRIFSRGMVLPGMRNEEEKFLTRTLDIRCNSLAVYRLSIRRNEVRCRWVLVCRLLCKGPNKGQDAQAREWSIGQNFRLGQPAGWKSVLIEARSLDLYLQDGRLYGLVR